MDAHVLAAAQPDGQYLRRLAHQRLPVRLQVAQLSKHLRGGGTGVSAVLRKPARRPQTGRAFSISGTVRVQYTSLPHSGWASW